MWSFRRLVACLVVLYFVAVVFIAGVLVLVGVDVYVAIGIASSAFSVSIAILLVLGMALVDRDHNGRLIVRRMPTEAVAFANPFSQYVDEDVLDTEDDEPVY